MQLGVLSNQCLDPPLNWTTLGPSLLDPLALNRGASLVAPPPLKMAHLPEWRNVVRKVRAADTLFWMQSSARPELPVHIASILAGRVRRSAFVVDAFRGAIRNIGALAVLQRLNPCFVAFREGYEELKQRYPSGRFEWLQFGIDTEVFDSVPGGRPVFAYWMGRRYEPLHEALKSYCSDRRLDYRYTLKAGEFSDPKELGRLVGQSQYFVVTPPDLDNPARTGGYSPLVMRYMEGLAAGARLLGVLPRSGEYQTLLPMDAILEAAPDGSDLAAKLDADRKKAETRLAVERARVYVRAQHSWRKRAEQVYQRLSTGNPTGFGEMRAFGQS
jgi:hypothetical protein